MQTHTLIKGQPSQQMYLQHVRRLGGIGGDLGMDGVEKIALTTNSLALPCLALGPAHERLYSGDWVNVVMPWESWMASSKKLSRARGVSPYLLYYYIYRACEDHPQSDLVLLPVRVFSSLSWCWEVGNAESSPSQLHYLLPLLWVGT
jgi:hypothetical protein